MWNHKFDYKDVNYLAHYNNSKLVLFVFNAKIEKCKCLYFQNVTHMIPMMLNCTITKWIMCIWCSKKRKLFWPLNFNYLFWKKECRSLGFNWEFFKRHRWRMVGISCPISGESYVVNVGKHSRLPKPEFPPNFKAE